MFIKKLLFLFFLSQSALAYDIETYELSSDNEVDIRIFKAEGNQLILGFSCDEGNSNSEEKTSQSLADDGIEVWMPDMLGSQMLPKTRSSIYKIPTEDLLSVLNKAVETDKDIYLIASGPDTELLLRIATKWKEAYPNDTHLKGAILLFPRLNDGKPEPGMEPKYVKYVGKTTLPLMVLEGERTPNRWGLNHLTSALKAGGSNVVSKLVPGIRGYFFKRQDPNRTEDVVTSQLSGLVKVSLFYLEGAQ